MGIVAAAPDPVDLAALFGRLRGTSRGLTVLTGAGVSTESGVPDFRSPGSPWQLHKPIDFRQFVSDPAARSEAWRRKFAMDDLYAGAQPGPAHIALAQLASRGVLRAVVTQNIDGLHQRGGLDPDLLVELHGNGTYARCLTCETRYELDLARRHLESTGEGLVCTCGGLVKSATIAFGQALRPDVIEAAMVASAECEMFLAIGSSLVVRPAARLPALARSRGATVVIVNREPTPLDAEADHVIRADAGRFLAGLALLPLGQHTSAFGIPAQDKGQH